MTVLTIVVPAYDAAAYLRRCLESLLIPAAVGREVEVIVVDDGSRDATGAIADEYAERHRGVVTAVHQANAGHGGAINTGLRLARGRYVKVVDADDWLDSAALAAVIDSLRDIVARGDSGADPVDALVSNFVYEKVDRRRKTAVRYADVLPVGRDFTWRDVGRFSTRQYLLMHSLIFRTQLLRECGLLLPERTFYVDNLYAYAPLRHVRTLHYLDVDLYRYLIGRPGQSVDEAVMISRVDQQLEVNRMMLEHLNAVRHDPRAPRAFRRYMLHHFEIVSTVSSILLIRAGTREAIAKKDRFWAGLRSHDAALYRRLRRSVLGQLTNLPGRSGRRVSVMAYKVAQRAVGFN